MRHPATLRKFLAVAVVSTGAGLLCLAAVFADAPPEPGGFGLVLGFFLLALGLIHFAVHAIAVLMRDHELWRSSHFTDVFESTD
ncbi:hypothetical protein [Catellatospora sp. NPDC049609]|uniref:hypothetical protein n=1 Tax=Catellatospora sp. NPDC049609 TaxID=3155505 RepID=UPI003417240B